MDSAAASQPSLAAGKGPETESFSGTKREIDADTTEVRFSIRSLLVAMAVMAVVTSALGAFIRHFPPEAHWRLAIYWGILAAILLAMFAYMARNRYQAERLAGHVLYRLVPHSYFFPRAPGCAITLAGTACLAFAPALWVAYSFSIADPNGVGWWRSIDFNAVYAIFAAGVGISIFWWRRIIVAENGFIKRNDFIPWDDCARWYWDACNKNVAVIATNTHGQIVVKVPAERRPAIEALLSERVTKKVTTD
jgi:hypothetical protein